MTADEYRECIRAMGLTPRRPSYSDATIHQDRDGGFVNVPDPETLSEMEREDVLAFIRAVVVGPAQ